MVIWGQQRCWDTKEQWQNLNSLKTGYSWTSRTLYHWLLVSFPFQIRHLWITQNSETSGFVAVVAFVPQTLVMLGKDHYRAVLSRFLVLKDGIDLYFHLMDSWHWVAKDVLNCSCGKRILCSRCCGSRGQSLDSAVKLLRIVCEWRLQELLCERRKSWARQLGACGLCRRRPASHTRTHLKGQSKLSSKTRLKCLLCLLCFQLFPSHPVGL